MHESVGIATRGIPRSDDQMESQNLSQTKPRDPQNKNSERAAQGSRWRIRPGHLPLWAVLIVQAVLSLRLIHTDSAFADEALYLWAGHIELAHLFHGTPIPLFPTYFSGAPVIYPPLGAMADSLGGLAGARILSLCFMLGVSIFLWSATKKLLDARSAYFATALFAILGPTQHLGAFATYDAMSLFFLTLAAWIVISASSRADGWTWMIAAAASLAIANATKYATALFDPIILVLSITAAGSRSDRRQTYGRAVVMSAYLTTIGIILILIATLSDKYYLTGITATTLTRIAGTTPPLSILYDSWSWTEILAVTAPIGLLMRLFGRTSRAEKITSIILAVASVLVPLEQARIRTDTSLIKHTDFGAWFAAILAGYAVSVILSFARTRLIQLLLALLLSISMAVPAYVGARQAESFYAWPSTTRLIATIKPMVAATQGPILFQNPGILEYYLGIGKRWETISGIYGVRLGRGHVIGTVQVSEGGNPGPYEKLIKKGYFKLIMLNDIAQDKLDGSFDQQISTLLQRSPQYHVAARVPWRGGYFMIWKHRNRRKKE